MKRTALFATCLFFLTTFSSAQTWVDVTEDFVVNPNFDSSIDGWTDTFEGASQNHGYQSSQYYNYYDDITIQHFAEAWQPKNDWWTGGKLGDGSIYQTIDNVPTGKYRLEADAIGVDQNGRNNPVTGVLLFMSYDRDEATTEIATADNTPEHFSVEFQHTGKSLTIGVRTESTTANWVAFDNVKLYWSGTEVKPTAIKLNQTSATVTQGETLQLTTTFTPSNTTFKSVAWTSSNEAVATVDANGLVTTHKPGIATITATAAKYEDVSARCIVTVESNEVAPEAVIINEVQQANIDMFIDPSFNYGGWIELYNSTDENVTLDGLYISDDKGHSMALTSSRNGTIPAKGFCTLWFDHFSWWTPKTLNFKLDTDGGTISISNDKGTVLSTFTYPPAIARTSYARRTDGGSEWAYTDQPTPGATNTSSAFAETRLETPLIDEPGGIYTNSITATVSNRPSGATIRYTTDGSTPTLDNGETSSNGRFDISATTILRVRFFQDGYLASPVTTRSFIYTDKDYTLPVLSLVSDERNLNGQDYGIFVRGIGNGRPGNGQSGNCNWNMDWDRPANIEYIDPSGTSVFNQEVGIESSGGWSRAWYPHSFNIKANKLYEGNNRMNYQFFKDKPFLRHKGLKVRNGGNDYNSGRIKDAAIQEVVRTSGLYINTQSYQPIHVFHNGRYIGLENLREPNSKNYAFANYGIGTDDEEMDQWKMSPDSNFVQQVGTKDVFDEWYSLALNASDALSYERIKQIVDIEEYINYCAVELYIAGTDWPKNNIKSFRARTEGESNSRFRFVLFDTDGAFATSNAFTWFESTQWWTFDQLYGEQVINKYGNRIYDEIQFTTLLMNMWKNEEFKKQFIDQFCIVAGSVFEPTRASEVIQAMMDCVAADGFTASSGTNVKNALSKSRQTSAVNNMRNYFGLSSPINVSLSSNLEESGLLINGLNVPTGKFSGSLFAPVTVTSAAPAGYRFVGWRSNLSTGSTSLFGYGSEWNYYDQGSLDGEDWTAADYAASWDRGNGPLGYFVTDASNSRGYKTFFEYGGDNNNKYPTYYLRKNVNLSQAPKASESITLNWIADDGFIVYVNGQEAGRYLMPDGEASFNTFATTYANGNPDSGTMELDLSLFHKGSNTIAVEVHNNAANSTDIYWDAELAYVMENADNIIATDPSYSIPASTSNITLTAVYEKLSDSDETAWDAHPVKINEVSASNDIFVSDLFKKSDWIELYNTTDEDYDIAGMYISDHLEEPQKWQIPASDGTFNTVIPAHGHLVIWCDKTEGVSQLHADFKLNNEDNSLVLLTAADESWADTLVYCAHDGYHSVGLYPDGSSKLYLMERPTIDAANMLTTLATEWQEPAFEQPIDDGVRDQMDDELQLAFNGTSLTLKGAETARLDIFNTTGQLVRTSRIQAASPVSLASLKRGIYIAKATTDDEETTLKFNLQ
ncbi:MAG: lamin tail domain-containing protein [Bacteroidales bacterium]|nr:lamin tail domain-containing protein [Bacteroidales bacterium]